MPLAITLVLAFHTFPTLWATYDMATHRRRDVIVGFAVATTGIELTLWSAATPSLTRLQLV